MRVCLPQNDKNAGARADQLATSRGAYRYAYDWPIGVATNAELSPSDEYSLTYTARSIGTYLDIGANLALMAIEGAEKNDVAGKIRARFEGLSPKELHKHLLTAPKDIAASMPVLWPKTWSQYEAFYQVWKAPPVVAKFHAGAAELDLAFGWQRVAGVNPMVLARAARLPDHLAVDAARYARVMGGGDTLAAALAEGRVNLADYAALDGVATGETDGIAKYVSAPIALFAVEKGSGQLRPVAIQCGQAPGPQNPVFSPGDGWRWRMAMTLVQVADANVHEGVVHLGRTHLVMEAANLAMERQLAKAHPLYVLLKPHCDTTFAINHSAKTSLIAKGGTVDRCFAPSNEAFGEVVYSAIATYRLDETTPALDLAARGLDDATALPRNPYREDVLPVWDALARFVADYVALYYTSDADVLADAELQAFVRELGAEDGGRLKGVPACNAVADVAFLFTRLIFIAGPQHSAVNFTQYPNMGFPPNMPGASFRPQLTAETPDLEAEYTAMLPPWRIATEGVTMIYLLSNIRDSKLGEYGLLHFTDPRVHPVLKAFQARLDEVEKDIEARDAERFLPYPHLRPSQILQSISI
jgi:arachidonate 15-lipoxygenase